jgi:hypothetical protein
MTNEPPSESNDLFIRRVVLPVATIVLGIVPFLLFLLLRWLPRDTAPNLGLGIALVILLYGSYAAWAAVAVLMPRTWRMSVVSAAAVIAPTFIFNDSDETDIVVPLLVASAAFVRFAGYRLAFRPAVIPGTRSHWQFSLRDFLGLTVFVGFCMASLGWTSAPRLDVAGAVNMVAISVCWLATFWLVFGIWKFWKRAAVSISAVLVATGTFWFVSQIVLPSFWWGLAFVFELYMLFIFAVYLILMRLSGLRLIRTEFSSSVTIAAGDDRRSPFDEPVEA